MCVKDFIKNVLLYSCYTPSKQEDPTKLLKYNNLSTFVTQKAYNCINSTKYKKNDSKKCLFRRDFADNINTYF